MNLLEVRYLHMPEVYRTMLSILCDYDPVSQENIIRTRRYISVLLAREPELAQVLLNFIDTPEEREPSHAHTRNASSLEANDNERQCTPQGQSAELTEERATNPVQKETTIVPEQLLLSGQVAASHGSGKKDGPATEHRCLTSTAASATAKAQTGIQTSSAVTEATPVTSLQSMVTDPQGSCRDPVPKSVPVVSIYHTDLFTLEKSTLAVTRPCQPQAMLTSQQSSDHTAGVDHTKNALTTKEHRDQAVFATNRTPSSCQSKVEMAAHSAPLLPDMVDCLNNKRGKQWTMAQTQTVTMGADRPVLPSESTPSTETPSIAIKASRCTTITATTSEKPTPTATATQPCTLTQNMRISKLLGQPSVAYLPAGHFIENRNTIIGTAAAKPAGVDKLPYGSSILTGKLNSASAKLHLLSTQAGKDKTGLLQKACGKATHTVSPSSAILPVSLPSVQNDSTTTTVMKVISKPGCRKTITFSKIVPVIKLDPVTGQDSKVSNVSFDKEIQVGQRQIYKKPKTIGRKEQATTVYLDAKQLVSNPSSQEEPSGKQQLADGQKESTVLQPSNITENNLKVKKPENQKEALQPAGSQQAHPTALPKASCQNPQNSSVVSEETLSVKPPASKAEQMTQQTSGQSVLKQEAEVLCTVQPAGRGQGTEKQLSSALVLVKPRQQGDNIACTQKAGSSKQKVHVVEVSMGSTTSPSAFPYIQQMVLPDGPVSTITLNARSPTHHAVQMQEAVTTTSTISIPSPTISISHTIPETKGTTSKPVTQIILPKGGPNLSISLPTPPDANYSNSSEKQKITTSEPDSQGKINKQSLTAEEAKTVSGNSTEMTQEVSSKTSKGNNGAAEFTTTPTAAQAAGNNQAKRRRSPSARRSAAAKAKKLQM